MAKKSFDELSDELKKTVLEKKISMNAYVVAQVLDIINLATSRGAFKGSELSFVGGIYDTLEGGIEKVILHVKTEQKVESDGDQKVTE